MGFHVNVYVILQTYCNYILSGEIRQQHICVILFFNTQVTVNMLSYQHYF